MPYDVRLNVVGYNQIDVKPGYNMFSVNFKQLGNDQTIKIDDLFPGGGKSDTAFTYGTLSSNADYIKVWDNESGEYATYFLYKKKPGNSAEKDYRWVDGSLALASNVTFKNGDAFWFYKRGDKTVTATTSGEVELSEVKEIEIKTGYNMIGSYFPTGWKLNDDYYTNTYWQNSGAVYGTLASNADYIKVWDNESNEYATYFLYKKKPGNSAEKDYRWVDGSLNVVTGNVLTPGKGAWFYHRGKGMTLEIKKQF